LGMRFSRFKAIALEIERGQVDMRVDPAVFRKWLGDCLDLHNWNALSAV